MAGEQQAASGAGEGDVGQPPLLGQLVGSPGQPEQLDLRDELGLVGGGRPAHLGQRGSIAAQRVRQGARVGEPPAVLDFTDQPAVGVGVVPRAGRVRREGALDQARDGDHVPLQPLRGVHGHQLNGIGVDLSLALLQPAFAGLGRVQPGEEGPQRRPVGAGREVTGHPGQRVEVRPGQGRPHSRPAGHLDVEQQRPLGLDDQVIERQASAAPQPPQGLGEAVQSLIGHRREPSAIAVDPTQWRQLVQRLDQAALVDHVGEHHDVRVGAGRRRCSAPGAPPVQLTRPRAQGDQVARPEPGGRPGEQPHQPVAAAGIVHHPQRGKQVGDLGGGQQPAEADHLDRQPARGQGRLDDLELRALAAQHGCRRLGAPPGLPPHGGEVIGHCGSLVLDRLVGPHEHVTRAGAGPCRQLPDGHGRLAAQRAGDDVRGVEHEPVVAPAGRQVEHPGRRGVGGPEPVGEAGKGAGARTPPAVDGLVGVTHRGHRVGVAEQRVQHLELGVAGVLVLVQQHRGRPGALGADQLRHALGEPGGQGNLVAEVKAVALALDLLVGRDDGQDLPAGAQSAHQLGHRCPQGRTGRATGRTAVVQLGQPLRAVGQPGVDLLDLDEVLGALAGQVEHGRDHRRDR